MKKYSRVCARIDLDAIEWNMDHMKRNIDEHTQIISVIKTDGYGHGACQIARLLEDKDYIWGFAVAALEEAVLLRKAGISKPILVLGCIFPEQYEDMLDYDIDMTVYLPDISRAVQLAVRKNKTLHLHIKLDTGMGRVGFLPGAKSVEQIRQIAALDHVEITGIFTHFAKADETDKTFTKKQLQIFEEMKQALADAGVRPKYYHTANSAGIIDVRESDYDLVRAGISTYGLYPSEEVHKENVILHPALELISHVIYVKDVGPGTSISYGGTYITDRPMKIATIPVGYGDGYPRSLSNKGYVLIHGQRAPILGRVCMDQFMVDVSQIENVNVYDKVTLVGYNGNEHLPVEVLSDLSGRFNYEFVCDLGKRIPREYLRHGEVVEQKDYFE